MRKPKEIEVYKSVITEVRTPGKRKPIPPTKIAEHELNKKKYLKSEEAHFAIIKEKARLHIDFAIKDMEELLEVDELKKLAKKDYREVVSLLIGTALNISLEYTKREEDASI